MNTNLLKIPTRKEISILAEDHLYRNTLFMALCSVFNAACGFFFWMIAARLYTVEEVGLATALISSLGLAILFSRLGFDYSIIRFFSSEDRGRIVGTSLLLTTAAFVVAGMIYIQMLPHLSPSIIFLKIPCYTLAFLLIGVLFSIASTIGNAFIADRKADHYFLINLFMALRIPALVPLASFGILGIFGSVGLGYLIASLTGLIILHRNIVAIRAYVDLDFIRRSFRFSSWNYISSIISVAPTLVIPIMVLNTLGESEAAKYYIAFALGNIIMIIPNSLGTSLFVEGSHGEGLKENILRTWAATLGLLVPSILVLFLIGDKLLGMLRWEYVEAFDLLKIIALSSFPVATYSIFVPIQNVRMNVKCIAGLNALRCILLLGLNYIFIQWYGILGAGYAWLATYVVISLWIGWMSWKEGWIHLSSVKEFLTS